jgi:hypothetical protein
MTEREKMENLFEAIWDRGLKVQVCSRDEGHEGPCNGLPCEMRRRQLEKALPEFIDELHTEYGDK